MSHGQQIRPVGPVSGNGTSLVDRIRAKAEANHKAGVRPDAPVRINVTPATFTGKDGKVVVGCRLGRHFLVPEHVDALLEALGVDPAAINLERYEALFS